MSNATQEERRQKLRQAAQLETNSLIQYIVNNHHRYEEQLLEDCDADLIKLLEDIPNNSALIDLYATFHQLKQDLIPHFLHEEEGLYPKVLAGEKVDWEVLNEEHMNTAFLLNILGKKIDTLQQSEGDNPAVQVVIQKLRTFGEDLHHHMFLENMVLFKR